MSDFVAFLQSFLKKPFDPNGDAINWILFLGFVIVVAFAWNKILRQITTE